MLSILPQNMNTALKTVSLREITLTHTHKDILKSYIISTLQFWDTNIKGNKTHK